MHRVSPSTSPVNVPPGTGAPEGSFHTIVNGAVRLPAGASIVAHSCASSPSQTSSSSGMHVGNGGTGNGNRAKSLSSAVNDCEERVLTISVASVLHGSSTIPRAVRLIAPSTNCKAFTVVVFVAPLLLKPVQLWPGAISVVFVCEKMVTPATPATRVN